jgi:lipoprotein-releasing system permease protein
LNIPLYIARRYFFSSRISGVVHIIAIISMLGILVGSFALITILSSFNGFETVVSKLYNTFDSDLKIKPTSGKYFHLDSQAISAINHLSEVQAFTPVIEENALVKYRDRQTIATFKAVDPDYLKTTGIDTMVLAGQPSIYDNGVNYALVGAGVGSKLNLGASDDMSPLQIFVPKKDVKVILNPEVAFNRKNILSGGIFSVQQDFDNKYIVVPIRFARELIEDSVGVTSYEVNLRDNASLSSISDKIQQIVGPRAKVLDRYEQQPMLYKVMHSEKLAVYLVLTFILLIAAFNLVGALLMLAIEKQKDMAILISMGATPKLVKDIILMEGVILSLSGALIGIGVGWFVCWLQQKYGFVKIAEGSTFVIDAYPISFQPGDFVLVLFTVVMLGLAASWYPAVTAFKRLNIEILRTAH